MLMGRLVPAEGSSEGVDEDAVAARHAACDVEPSWLDEDLPPDPEGDDRVWPGDLDEVIAQCDAEEAERAQIRWRLLAAGIEPGGAHAPGGPVVPGVQSGPGGGFGQGQPWDAAAPDTVLAARADYASGVTRDVAGVSDDEVFGVLGARRRLGARQCWERLAAIAEIIRRRPAYRWRHPSRWRPEYPGPARSMAPSSIPGTVPRR
jgi:hypothetical protein